MCREANPPNRTKITREYATARLVRAEEVNSDIYIIKRTVFWGLSHGVIDVCAVFTPRSLARRDFFLAELYKFFSNKIFVTKIGLNGKIFSHLNFLLRAKFNCERSEHLVKGWGPELTCTSKHNQRFPQNQHKDGLIVFHFIEVNLVTAWVLSDAGDEGFQWWMHYLYGCVLLYL